MTSAQQSLVNSTSADVQRFGESPESVRETDHYEQEYIEQFVDRWDRLIDWDARAEAEGDFFIRLLHEHGAKSVLDVATGTGFHSVRLLREEPFPPLARWFERKNLEPAVIARSQITWSPMRSDVWIGGSGRASRNGGYLHIYCIPVYLCTCMYIYIYMI